MKAPVWQDLGRTLQGLVGSQVDEPGQEVKESRIRRMTWYSLSLLSQTPAYGRPPPSLSGDGHPKPQPRLLHLTCAVMGLQKASPPVSASFTSRRHRFCVGIDTL
jgi:hypothetical protein